MGQKNNISKSFVENGDGKMADTEMCVKVSPIQQSFGHLQGWDRMCTGHMRALTSSNFPHNKTKCFHISQYPFEYILSYCGNN